MNDKDNWSQELQLNFGEGNVNAGLHSPWFV